MDLLIEAFLNANTDRPRIC